MLVWLVWLVLPYFVLVVVLVNHCAHIMISLVCSCARVVLFVSWCAHVACMVVIVMRYVWLYLRVGVLAGVCHCMLRCLICLVLKFLWVYPRGCVLVVLVCTSVEGCSS